MSDRFSEEEKKELIKRYWRNQEAARAELRRRHRRIREAADEAQDPEERRLLSWAAENWSMMEKISRKESGGIMGEAFAALPSDLRSDLHRTRLAGKLYPKYTPEQRELLEAEWVYSAEERKFGEAHPETEAHMRRLQKRRKRTPGLTAKDVMEMNRRIVEASTTNDPTTPEESAEPSETPDERSDGLKQGES